MNLHALVNQSSPEKSPIRPDPRLSACFKVENVCQPGNTLLWDLLQDEKIVSTFCAQRVGEKLYVVLELFQILENIILL